MAHNIFGERFFSLREPAWHGLGTVSDEELPALTVLNRMGEPVYTLEPVTCEVEGHQLVLNERAIVRHPTPEDPEFVSLGVAGPEYELFTPGDCATAWDEAVGRHVETMGLLARGARFFITGHIEDIDVKGDEVSLYQYALVELDGVHANEYGVTGQRIVCANTLKVAQDIATERFRIIHDRHARERMRSWMAEMNELATSKVAMLREAFDLLASYTVTDAELNSVLDAAYPLPTEPVRNCPDEVLAERTERWERRAAQVRTYQEGARSLFNGDATGSDFRAFKGTAWGAYNSVVECEDFRRPSNRSTALSAAESATFGERAQAKERAFEASMALVR